MEKKTIALYLIFFTGILILCSVMVVSFKYTSQIPDKQAMRGLWVDHTRIVINELNLLEKNIYKTALAKSLKSSSLFNTAREQVYTDLNILQNLTVDNPSQQKNLKLLSGLIIKSFLTPEIIVPQVKIIRHEEETLLAVRNQYWQLALQRSKMTLVIIQLLLYVTILLLYLLLFRELVKRRRTITDSELEEDRLYAIVALQNAVMISDLNVTKIMKIIVDCTRELVKADGSVIERVENNEMVYVSVGGSALPFAGMRIPVNSSFSGKAVLENLALKCDDAETDPNVDRAACKRVGLRSMVVVPLLRNSEVFGVLKVFSSKRGAFTQKDVNTLEIIATLLSARLTDALSFSTMNEINSELTSQKEKLLYSNAELGELATTDGLTGLRNQRYFMEKLNEEFQRAKSHNSIFSLVLMDVDYFKKHNDNFGHVAGDKVLRQIGVILRNVSRDTDIVARYGGEEFAVILPGTDANGAALIAERICAVIAASDWEHNGITISAGICTYGAAYKDVKTLLETADEGLYAAKKAGRNCVRKV